MRLYIAFLDWPDCIRCPNYTSHSGGNYTRLKLASALSDKLGLNPNARHRLKGEAAFRDEKPEEESFILKLMREAREDN